MRSRKLVRCYSFLKTTGMKRLASRRPAGRPIQPSPPPATDRAFNPASLFSTAKRNTDLAVRYGGVSGGALAREEIKRG